MIHFLAFLSLKNPVVAQPKGRDMHEPIQMSSTQGMSLHIKKSNKEEKKKSHNKQHII
jgi:hypothetical protein